MKKRNATYATGGRNIRVLVVDDEPDILTLMSLTLKFEGYDPDTCWNGEGIVSIIEENRPDIILLDVKMDGVDGRDICKMIKQNPTTKQIKIILFSANEDLRLMQKRCGADASLSKPYDMVVARQIFREILE